MQPIRVSTSTSLSCDLADGAGVERCLAALTERAAQQLAARFAGRGRVEADVVTHRIALTVRDPLLGGAGEHVIEASVAFRVRAIAADGERAELVPRVVAELMRREPGRDYAWIEPDTDDKLGRILEEIDAALRDTQSES